VTLFLVRNSGCGVDSHHFDTLKSPTTLPHNRAVELGLAGGRVSFYFRSKTLMVLTSEGGQNCLRKLGRPI